MGTTTPTVAWRSAQTPHAPAKKGRTPKCLGKPQHHTNSHTIAVFAAFWLNINPE